MAFDDTQSTATLVRVLLLVAERIHKSRSALLRGDVVSLWSGFLAGSDAVAVYASMPVVFPAGLAALNDSVPPTVFVWLFPLLQAEVEFVRTEGWSEFEDRLESAAPDLCSLHRGSVI